MHLSNLVSSFLFIVLFSCMMSSFSLAADVTLAWDPSTNPGVASYKVYSGTSSRSYVSAVDVGNARTYTITGLNSGTYYFAVTARYTSGTETGYSNEVSKTFSVTPPSELQVSVDSSYTGYSATPINDGIVNANGGTATTWASAESTTSPHWITVNLPTTTQVNSATIWWAFNTQNQLKYMVSQLVEVQYWNGSAYQTVATIQPTDFDVPSSSVSFAPVTTSMLRFYQPPDQGSPTYTRVMWVTEIDYGLNSISTSLLPAPTNVTVK